MSDFEFFFSFYGLLLGLSVAELTGGFARLLHERHRVRFGWLTPLLALFVAIDLATFWNQAWRFFREAPFNPALLLIGLVIAATFYVAASVTFPRVTAEGVETRIDLDEHFWAHRRVVFGCVLAANAMVWILLGLLALADPAWAGFWTPRLIFGVVLFAACTATAAFAPRRGVVIGALVLVLAYTLWNMVRAGYLLFSSGVWSPAV
ncbi:hypothetical protein [Brevundimonas aurifodinae]|uniref:Tripartite tricarboxylate transporter TctB family protein n=2 Tax=Brevundimonas TaxID=41275 RepID=A0ABV1NRQ5_9CAUL|nr:MAG: hypothetical protein B7Z42_11535 [Brevundimonas sp. 12-68-7]OYX33770.1 MAG: hypothetical protein B7Z01_08370 [Brevundimonas subvibrioides]